MIGKPGLAISTRRRAGAAGAAARGLLLAALAVGQGGCGDQVARDEGADGPDTPDAPGKPRAVPPFLHEGLRWLGVSASCSAPPTGWTAERLFAAAVPASGVNLCLFRWTATVPTRPTLLDVEALFADPSISELTEDVPVLVPMSTTPAETSFYEGLRGAIKQHIGDAQLLPRWPGAPVTRIAVIDTAPDAPPGAIHPGLDRHGDTLAHLLEDLLCRPPPAGSPGPDCIAEITTALAMPWESPGVIGASGGHFGTLSDLSRAIERAVLQWEQDRRMVRRTPPNLILNLSVGWEHTPGIADCPATPSTTVAPPARAVQAILQYAAARGALIFSAAGNASGGPRPRAGLTCPGTYQAMSKLAAPGQALLYTVSGVDYADQPLASARTLGHTGIVGVGVGGVSWKPEDPLPPALTGSSVATATATAVGAIVWAQQPSWSASQVAQAAYDGGVDAGPAEHCPASFDECRTRRVSACGALQAAGAAVDCIPAPPQPGGCPSLTPQLSALAATITADPVATDPPMSPPFIGVPFLEKPTMQVSPWTFPAPIQATCPTCWVSSQMSGAPRQFLVPEVGRMLLNPMLIVQLFCSGSCAGSQRAVTLGHSLVPGEAYVFELPPTWNVVSAMLTGYDTEEMYSISEQLFVEH